MLLTAFLMMSAGDLALAPPIRNYDVDPRVLAAALAAPESARSAGERPRFCALVDDRTTGERLTKYRTRSEWIALGVVPVRS
ncbi:MAG TPA: hypothetical protein VF636_06220 [Sphingomonas sp.]